MLRYAGCNADTHLLSAAFGDEIAADSVRTGEMNARENVIRIERSLLPSRTASDSMV